MTNGYDTHSMAATGLREASSSAMRPMAVRDRRYTRNGIGWRTEEPAPILFPGGQATGKRGQVDERARSWERAESAAVRPARPREALPPWLADRDEDEMDEAPLNAQRRNRLPDSAFALPNRRYPIDTPARARSALSRVEQFGSDEEKRKVRAAVKKRYPKMDVE